jgi:hypothetical protein
MADLSVISLSKKLRECVPTQFPRVEVNVFRMLTLVPNLLDSLCGVKMVSLRDESGAHPRFFRIADRTVR